ncbi:hypothetical protein A2Y85_08465 [candidate division WOR-3 bacterium RBG_13_43_14]|uniref:TGS domain-containing protein n=1 Tax=candidate division WOR-3 bacterium RBG_13_43_14 TaxID=1802590 RepID=A0A1F4UEL1_UNCW3|nr:MAG: hypothetical protein A2Y85_08465 [candidate division WOR-3 bacterium RBG_13_43_14]
MPANLPPQYFEIEKKYRDARDPQEKLVYLQQLLASIPKHKGTEKLQADLKSKISKTKEAIDKQRKTKGGSGGTSYQVEKQGAGQVVLVGLPNCGKSSLVNILTNARVDVGDYPFTTKLPQIGMIEYENIKIQIVDTPPFYEDAPAWLYGLYRNGDILLIMLDGKSDIEQDLDTIKKGLAEHNIFLTEHEFGDIKKSVIIINKIDDESMETRIRGKVGKIGSALPVIAISVGSNRAIDELKHLIFEQLWIIRVYTKKIGKPVEKNEPVVLKAGTTVIDAAEHIHKDFKKNLKFARLWNEHGFSGQRVEKHQVLVDEDIIEFHT